MERKPKKIPTAAEMLRRLASLCARSEQCEADIAQKIYRSGLSREEGNEILSKLREGRFIDDSRFARASASASHPRSLPTRPVLPDGVASRYARDSPPDAYRLP